jgi:hypothetical protein
MKKIAGTKVDGIKKWYILKVIKNKGIDLAW